MKGEFIMKANMINTNSIKTYLCAVVMLLGMSANAWGTSCDLKIWDKASSSYITWKTIDESYTFGSESYPYYDDGDVYHTVICWTPSTYSAGYPSNPYYYYNQQYGDRGTPSELYAVYLDGVTYTSAPDFQVGFCTYTLTAPSGLSVNTNYESKGNTYVRFDWTPGDATNAVNQKFCYGKVGEVGTCKGDVSKSDTYVGDLRSKLSNGEYWWSIQALGDNDEYCNSSVVEGPHFCIDEITTSTPSGVAASSLTTSSATVSWSALSDAAGYVLTIKKKSDGSKVTGFDEKDVEGTSASVTGLLAGTTYKVELTAYNSCADISLTNNSYEFTTLIEYAITLDGNGGSDGIAGVYANATSLHEITEPTKTGYHVEGYYTTDACATKVATAAGALQASITVSATEWTNSSSQWTKGGDATFYANWAANTHTVTLDQNGGSGGSSSVTATYNSAMPSATMPTTPPAVGKVFDGYYYNSVQYYDEDGNSAHVWDVDDDVTLVASWTTSTPTLTIASVDNVVISSTTPSLAEKASTSVSYNSTVTLSHGDPESGYYWLGWNVYETGNESNIVTVTNNQFAMPNYDVTVSANLYTDLVFSCSELTLTPHLVTDGTPIFITSVANKKVRSQDYITITGSGLTPSTALTFPGLDSKFEVLTGTGGVISTDASGAIDVNAYIFYTPAADATTDGIDEMSGLTVSVGGAKPKQVSSLTQSIIGRHLPTAGYVIAGKKNNKWYALPSTMSSTSTPDPSEIAVNDIDNPSIAYTSASNIYGLVGPTNTNISNGNGQYVRLTMSINDGNEPAGPAPLFGSGTAAIGKSGNSKATSDLSAGWWWALTQTNTSITNPQDAKYSIKCANSSNTLSIKNSPFQWGQYASGVEELRLIPASDIPFTEAEVVEWGQHGGVVEVDATAATGIDATSVIAHLNGASSDAITLVQTRASDAKNRSSKYNYTVDFEDGIDFAAAASNGAMLTLEWKNGETVKAMSNIIVPKIIASTGDMKTIMSGDAQWETEVHVLPGVTLTANGGSFESSDVKINLLEIYPGATVSVTTGTLNVASLVLRNGWRRIGGKTYDVARLHVATTANLTKANITDGWYSDWYIDYDQYYPIAVPFPVATNRITYKNTKSSATGGVTIRYYDGERRAEHEQQDQEDNWVAYTWGGTMPANLEPSKGYAMTAKRPSGKAFSIVRMPMTFTNPWTALGEHGYVGETHKDQVTVTGWGKGTTSWYAMGWNFVGNPYMCTFNGNDDGISGKITTQEGGNVKYATIPDLEFQNYYQVPIAEADLKPASGFFIQADNASPQTITFNADKIVPPSAPVRYTVQQERIPEQEAYIRLSYDGGNDLMGLIIGEDYTEGYEPNADLAKVLGGANAVKTYMHYADMDMAYVAINETLAKEWIPVTVNIPADGEYTYSLTSYSEVNDLEGVYLIDYMNSNQVTNLIEEDYTFVAEAGTSTNRFSINAKVGARDVPTDIDVTDAEKNSGKAVKFLYRDKLYIMRSGRIYDATGKQVKGGAQ